MLPISLFALTPNAAKRVFKFFTTQINNDHIRNAYLNATRRFAQWCETHSIRELAVVEPFHVAPFIKKLQDKELQESLRWRRFRYSKGVDLIWDRVYSEIKPKFPKM